MRLPVAPGSFRAALKCSYAATISHLLVSKWWRHKSNIACSSQGGLLTPRILVGLQIACCLTAGFAAERFRTGLKRVVLRWCSRSAHTRNAFALP
jgi:hypothetical protein